LINNELLDRIKYRIRQHHKLYELPVIAEYWEEIFAKSIEDVEGYTDWRPDRSHSVGKDQICTIGGNTLRVSNKSGKYNSRKNTLQISGSRSGEYKTLKQKLKFFSDKQEDVYVCLATNTKKSIRNEYYLFTFNTKILNYSEAIWEPKISRTGKQNGWYCKTDEYYACIQQSLSGQLWTTINTLSTNLEPEMVKID
jgi:hypothetical protein